MRGMMGCFLFGGSISEGSFLGNNGELYNVVSIHPQRFSMFIPKDCWFLLRCIFLLACIKREGDSKAGEVVLACDCNGAVVQGDDFLGNGKAQTGAAGFCGAGAINAIELIKKLV